MPPFRFRLRRVLQWQERVCRLEEERLRQLAAELAETDSKLDRLAAERVSIEQEFAGHSSLSPRDLQALAQYRRRAAAERLTLEQEREGRLAALAAQREKLLAERRKMQVIEKLRDRALQEYTRAADRELETVSYESYLSTWIARR
jgi:flagellar export protein FliJ